MHTRFLLVTLLAVVPGAVAADEAKLPSPAEVVKRSLPFLEQEGVAWMQDRKCVSCHQVSSMLWTFHAAADAGFPVDRTKLAEWTKWSLDWRHWMQPTWKGTEVQAAAGNTETMAQLILGRPAAEKDPQWTQTFRQHLEAQRDTNGVWRACGQLPLGKRPARETQEASTMWVLLALKSRSPGHAPDERITGWLKASKPGQSTEWWALKLLLDAAYTPTEGGAKSLESLLKHQHADGGWGWLVKEPSDALGTGLALYALSAAGVPPSHTAIQRAHAFLARTQQPDGSWEVPGTRAKDKNKVRSTTTYWGTAWAALGIIKTTPKP